MTPPDFVSMIGTLLSIAPCGRSSLWYLRQASNFSAASASVWNQCWFRHSARKRPLKVRRDHETVRGTVSPTQDAGIFRRFSGPGEVQDHPSLVSAEIHVQRDKFAALIDPDRLGIARCSANPIKRRDNIFAAVAVANVRNWHVAGKGINDGQDTQFLSRRQLIVHVRRQDSPPDCFVIRLTPSPGPRLARLPQRGHPEASPSPAASVSCV